MIPGISIIVFLKFKDLGIRDGSTRFCFTDLLCLGLRSRGPAGGWLCGFRGPGILQGLHTNEACSSLMEQIQEKQTCDVAPSGGPLRRDPGGMCVCVRQRLDKREIKL